MSVEQDFADAVELLAASTAVSKERAAHILAVEVGGRLLTRVNGDLAVLVETIERLTERREEFRHKVQHGPGPEKVERRSQLVTVTGELELVREEARERLALHAKIAAFIETHAAAVSTSVGAYLDARTLDEKANREGGIE